MPKPKPRRRATETFARFLRSRRKARGDRQQDAAAAVGVVESTWRSWEHGKLPTLETAYHLADYLGVTVDELRPHVEASRAVL